MPKYQIIALDLDGTLLNSRKELTPRSYRALELAAKRGIHIVPTTGRVYSALPVEIRELPFVRYIISVNGAQVFDLKENAVLYRSEMSWQRSVELMSYLDTLPVIYDCFMDNNAWMTAKQKELIDDFAPDEHYRKMLHEVRQAVPELKAFLAEQKRGVQKIQFFIQSMEQREQLLRELPGRFPDLLVSSSVVNNIEFNAPQANKGAALLALAGHLNIPQAATMAFGDGLNDLSMIRDAGLGVAMSNACPAALELADYVTLSCDEDGVAAAVEQFCLEN